jgi:hypothetical protein
MPFLTDLYVTQTSYDFAAVGVKVIRDFIECSKCKITVLVLTSHKRFGHSRSHFRSLFTIGNLQDLRGLEHKGFEFTVTTFMGSTIDCG